MHPHLLFNEVPDLRNHVLDAPVIPIIIIFQTFLDDSSGKSDHIVGSVGPANRFALFSVIDVGNFLDNPALDAGTLHHFDHFAHRRLLSIIALRRRASRPEPHTATRLPPLNNYWKPRKTS